MSSFTSSPTVVIGLAPESFADAETRASTLERDVRPMLKEHCFPCHGEGVTELLVQGVVA